MVCQLRAHSGPSFGPSDHDWCASFSDAEMLPMITKMIEFSRYQERECAVYGYRYFDTSQAFSETLDDVVNHVRLLMDGDA